MNELQPDLQPYEQALILAVRRAGEIGGQLPAEDALGRTQLRVREASQRLTALFIARSRGPLDSREAEAVGKAALTLAAAVIRSLNDCLNAGALQGYAAITESRVAAAVESQAGPPLATSDDVLDIDPIIGGWLTETNLHLAALTLMLAHPDIIVREAFAAIGAAAALAAALARRDGDQQA